MEQPRNGFARRADHTGGLQRPRRQKPMNISGIGLLTSLGAGIVSFLSPCVLPLVPGYVSFVAGDTLTASAEPRRKIAGLHLSLCFVLGFSTVFVTMGASTTSLGQWLQSYRYEAGLIGGGIVILLGLFMLGLTHLSWLQRDLLSREPQGRATPRRLFG